MRAKVLLLESISQEDFEAYEAVQESGVVNMFDPRVPYLAGFSPDVHKTIIHFYTELCNKFPGIRKG